MHPTHTFLLIGQSNMAGRGELSAVEPIEDSRILMFRDNNWIPAVEPLHQDRPEAGIGLAMSFAALLLDHHPEITIGLIPCAVGATSISEWMPGTELYQKTIGIAHRATDALQGILWHQGEYDANDRNRVAVYAERLTFLVESIRSDFNSPHIPFITGELGSFINATSGSLYGDDISRILKSLVKNVPNYACVSSIGLTDKGDGLHFNSRSLREFGKRYASELLRLWNK
ncbi:MAG: sialate O-acetylesterase [Candidatus Marinimicrobia bacterium]|nr:sialate O-acetylesterase [Candidatus Neomarinimicrobiota bacterium]